MKKSLIIIPIIIIIIVLIGIGVFAYVYFKTDTFKSNKQLFFESMSNMDAQQKLNQYFEKKMSEKTEFNGDITYEALEDAETLDITFEGSNNPEEEMTEVRFGINYKEDEIVPLEYVRNQSLVGIKSKPIINKYITINYDKEPENNLGIEETVKKIFEIPKINIAEEISFIKEKYGKKIDGILKDEMFSKVEENEKVGYKLQMKTSDWTSMIETIMDEEMVQRVNDKFGTELTEEEIKETLKQENDEEKESSIIIWENGNKGQDSYEISIDKTLNIKIQKEYINDTLKYESVISISEYPEMEIILKASFEGISTLKKVNEEYSAQVKIENKNEKTELGGKLAGEVSFVENTDISELLDKNTLMLTPNDDEAVDKFLNKVRGATENYISKQVDEMGIDMKSIFENTPVNILMQFLIVNSIHDAINSSTESMEQQEKVTFNKKFENYEGHNVSGTKVRNLLEIVIQNNIQNSYNTDKQVDVNFNGTLTDNPPVTKSTIEKVEINSKYKVKTEIDSKGYVCKVIIEES